jgi:hypothetical protein
VSGYGTTYFGQPIGVGVFNNPPNPNDGSPSSPGGPYSNGHLDNANGSNVAYIFSNQSNSIAQALVNQSNTNVATTFAANTTYTMTASVALAESAPGPTNRLAFEVYWLDSSNVAHTVLDGILTSGNSTNYGSVAMNQQSLEDFSFSVSALASGNSAVGQQINIGFFTLDNAPEDTQDPSSLSNGEFDIDNVRLTSAVVPEPGIISLVGGAASLLMFRRRRRQR